MIKSMTGYGAATAETATLSIQVEIKTLNSKFSDIQIKLPRFLNSKETEVRNIISEKLERGKISVFATVENKDISKKKYIFNRDLAAAYLSELKEAATMYDIPSNELLRIVTAQPDVFSPPVESAVEDEWDEKILPVIQEAVRACDEFRITEGKSLYSELEGYINTIADLLKKTDEADPGRAKLIREKLSRKMSELKDSGTFDENRMEQEILFYIEKLDISEEKVRLKSHLEFFISTLESSASGGKKLGFIAQEIGREINTIGSKAADASIQKFVIGMKEELEKIKEQVLNIL